MICQEPGLQASSPCIDRMATDGQPDEVLALHPRLLIPVQDKHGPLNPSKEYLEEMNGLLHDPHTLQRAGYTLHQLSQGELDKKRRCYKCNRLWQAKPQRSADPSYVPKRPSPVDSNGAAESSRVAPNGPQNMRCRFHAGRVYRGRWSCCDGNTFAPPCDGRQEHVPRIYAHGELAKHWRFYATPKFANTSAATPVVAVVIDCEMGTNLYGESELIRVSVIDFFSKAILLDSLVWPSIRMLHYNTKFSGVTRQAMLDAKNKGTCIFGRANARKRIWEFVGPDTIVVGHAGQGDLLSLRWIHTRIIDTLLIETKTKDLALKKELEEKEKQQEQEQEQEQEQHDQGQDEEEEVEEGGNEEDSTIQVIAEVLSEESHGKGIQQDSPKKKQRGEGGLSLKALASLRLNRIIQIKGQGHDSLEDAIATRDVLHWNIEKALKMETA